MSRTLATSQRTILTSLTLMVSGFFLLQACGGGGGGGGGATPAPKAFGTPVIIETENLGDASSPQIAFDASGNALAVWRQSDGTRNNIWSNRYTAGTGWGTAELIETAGGDAAYPEIAIDASGNALAVWSQNGGTYYNIISNRYTAGTGWGTAVSIEGSTGDAFLPQIAFDASGNALVVWQQFNGTVRDIWANRYIAGTGTGTGWRTAARIDNNAGDATDPQIAFDMSGNALAVWEQDGDSTAVVRNDIWSNRFTAGTGWGTAARIETDNAGYAHNPKLAIDASGNALAVWYQYDGTTRLNIWSNRYTAGTGWGVPELIETNDELYATDPQIAIDASGNALAVWEQSDAGFRSNIWSNRYTAGSGWGAPELIETNDAGSAYTSALAFDASGNALTVWYQFSGTSFNIWSNRYTVGTGWGTAALIENDDAGNAYSPQIAIDASGNALAVWEQSDGTRHNVWSSRYQ